MHNQKVKWFLVVLLTLLFVAQGSWAEEPAKSLAASIRFVTIPPVIDGDLNDPVWRQSDLLTGFTVPGEMGLARDQSEVRLLYDNQRLYVGLTAYESTPSFIVRRANTVFNTDSFELFIQPDLDREDYYQAAVSVNGNVFTGRGQGSAWKTTIEIKTRQTSKSWTAELAIPLADLGLTAPSAGEVKNIRFNICRNDWARPGKHLVADYSSFSVLETANFHIPAWWLNGQLTQKASAPRMIVNKPHQTNLLVNPEFDSEQDNYPTGWRIPSEYWQSREVYCKETEAMSGEWIIGGKGKSYVILDQDINLIPDKKYTVRVKARKFGECALGIQQPLKDGSTAPILWNCGLTTEFRYYYATFTAHPAAGKITGLRFYKIGPATNTDGIEIASIHLFEGELSPLSIRHFVRTGLEIKVEGSEQPLPPNYYGKRGEKLRILAVAYTLYTSREYLEILAGLNIDADILISTGENQDVYYTEGDPDAIEKRLTDNQYDGYMVGIAAVGRVGKALVKKMSENIEKGAGLVINTKATRGGFNEILTKYTPSPAGPSHYLKKGLPVELYPMADPIGEVRLSQAGKGRILDAVNMGYWEFKIALDYDKYPYIVFPHERYSAAWLARLIYFASGKNSTSISDVSFADGRALVKSDGAVDGSVLQWRLEDKNGDLVSEGTAAINKNRSELILPHMTMTGYHVLSVWLKDGKGAVSDYGAYAVKQGGPEITEAVSVKEFYTGAEAGEFRVKAVGIDETMRLEWALEDFAGRVLELGSINATENVSFKVPLGAVHTNLARLWVYLQSGKTRLDVQRLAVYLPDRDGKRLLNDFTVGVWPEGCQNMDATPYVDHTLERIGVRMKQFYIKPLSLNHGLGVSSYLVVGTFNAYPSKNNIRQPSLKDPVVLKDLEAKVLKEAKSDRKYGPISASVTDEPDLTERSGTDDVDAHPESLKEYRKRMRTKYGTIDQFNHRCSTSYKSFDEIGMVSSKDARARSNYAEFVEWRNYMVDSWVEAFRLVVDTYHSVNPGVPMAMHNSFGQRALNGSDYWKLLTRAGFGFSNEYTSINTVDPFLTTFDEFYRSFRPDMRVWGYIGYTWSKDHATFQPWWFALHRYGGFTFYDTSGLEPGKVSWNLVDVPGMGLSLKGKILEDGLAKSALLNGLGKVFLEYDWAKRDIAVLYSQPSLLVAWCRSKEQDKNELFAGSPYHAYIYGRHCLRCMLEELLYQYDFISPEQISQGALGSYKVLILPHIEALSDDTAALIKGFLAKGGTVIADCVPGTYDELGTPRKESPFLTDKKNFVLFNSFFNDTDVEQRKKMLTVLNKQGVAQIVRCNDVVTTHGREAMHFVRGDMNVYAITRDFRRSADKKEQQFSFPTEGHLYDLREGRYLGKTNQISCVIPNAGTKVYGLYPYQVTGMQVDSPAKVQGGKDLVADITLKTSTGKTGHHVLHIEVLPPEGEARWFMKRNVAAPDGKTVFRFRMAENDPLGTWTLRITDVMTGMTVTKKVVLFK
ncbi:MAG: sugar-binding protein [Phycisphaerae bacterium]